MKTFYQFLQEMYTPHPDHDKPDVYLSTIVSELTHEQQVLFALHCAEDCYKLIKIKRLKSLAYNCIQLIKQWLNSPDKPSDQKLRQAADDAAAASRTAANTIDVSYTAPRAAANAARAAASTEQTAADYAYAAAYTAADAYAYGTFDNAYDIKMTQYRQDAFIIGSSYTPDIPNTTFNDIVKALKQNNFEKNGIEAFLDALQESEYKDLLVHDGQGVYLAILPYLKAKTTNELADLLYKNKNRFMLALKTIK